MDQKLKVLKARTARKLIGGLSLVLALSSFGGCGLNNNKQNESQNGTEVSEESQVIDSSIEKDPHGSANFDNIENFESLVLPNIGNYDGNSLTEALYIARYPYDFEYREKIAEILGIKDYSSTEAQDTYILELLKKYALNHKDEASKNPVNDKINDESHDHVLSDVKIKHISNGAQHDTIIYKECEDKDCSYVEELERKQEKHKFANQYVLREKENDDGYDEVTYGYCDQCDEIVEIKRRYIDKTIKDCKHLKTHEVIKYEHEDEHEHEEVTYDVCDKCGHETVSSKKTATHDDIIYKIRDNGDGTHSLIGRYICSNGNVYEKPVQTLAHNFGETLSRKENVTEDGYYLVKYRVCGICNSETILSKEYINTKKCNHSDIKQVIRIENETETGHEEALYDICAKCKDEKEISRTLINHSYTSGPIISTGEGTHYCVLTYKCPATGASYDRIGNENKCSYGSPLTRHEDVTEDGYYLVEYETCSACNHEHTISKDYVDIKNCKHLDSYSVTECEKETELGHEEAMYNVCKKCGIKTEVSRKTVDHKYIDGTKTSNENGTHSFNRHYVCPNGKTFDRLVTLECSYITLPKEILNESETGHKEVAYKVCSDCEHKVVDTTKDVEHKSVNIIKDNGNGTHSIIIHYVCSSGKTYDILSTTSTCSYGSTLTRQEDVTEDGYYLVKYKVCSLCNHEHIISRDFVDTKECDHSNTYNKTEYEKETKTGHEKVVYKVCRDCGIKTEVSREKVEHTYTDKITSNNDGTHLSTRRYVCPNGKTYEEKDIINCSYTVQPSRVEKETETGHEEVVYKECGDCNHKVEVSRKQVDHTYTDGPLKPNGNDTHSFIRRYSCPKGATYDKTVTSDCLYVQQAPVIGPQIVDEKGTRHEETIYKECSECNSKVKVKSTTIVEHEHHYSERVNVITGSDGKLYEAYECLTSDDKCKAPNKIIREHEHSYTYADPYRPNGDGTHTRSNGSCLCGDTKSESEACSYIYTNVTERNFGSKVYYDYDTMCEHCHGLGVSGRSNVKINNGDHYSSTPNVSNNEVSNNYGIQMADYKYNVDYDSVVGLEIYGYDVEEEKEQGRALTQKR